MSGFKIMSYRMIVVYIAIILGFSYVAYVLYHVQVDRHDELYQKAKNKYTTVRKTQGSRGEIYDVSGNLIVGNIPCTDVCADPSITGSDEKCREMAAFLSPILKVSAAELYQKLSNHEIVTKKADGTIEKRPRKFVILRAKLPFEDAERLRADVHSKKWKCIFFRETYQRYYPKKHMFANLLGFTTFEHDRMVPVLGLEKYFESTIRSETGVTEYQRDRKGTPIDGTVENKQIVQDGLNLYLTISEPIQSIVEEELDKLMAEYHPAGAYAVLANPWTGDVLAAAQRPTFDPNERGQITPQAYRCRITDDPFEPGSVMKPIIVAGALDRGIVTPEMRFDCENGRWVYAKKVLNDSHRMGNLTVSEIIQQSSNIGTAKIALKMGDKVVDEVIREFGFGQKTGIPIKNETVGIYRKLAKWDTLSITRFPIGQGISVSAFQLIRAYCALANGGYPVKIRLVDRIENPTTGEIKKIPVDYGKKIFKRPTTQQEITAMMKSVTGADGTAKKAAVKGYYVAGKTGTAQKWEPGELYIDSKGVQRRHRGHYSKKRYFANFIGFVPADKPRFVLLVAVDEPKGRNYYGGAVSGPYFRSIAERTLKYMNVQPDYDWQAEEAARKAAKNKKK